MGWFKKAFFLFLALLLPIAVFVFLKLFGKNEFTVKPLFQESVESATDCKSFVYKAPYFLHDSVLNQVGWLKDDSLTVFIFNSIPEKDHREYSIQVDRIFTELSSKNFHIVYLSERMKGGATNTLKDEEATLKELGDLSLYRNCIFLMRQPENAVMVDSKKRIAGQYDLTDLEDADRLIMEMKILLRKY